MAKDKITEYDATAANNTVVGDVNLAENSALPSDMNNAVRELMSHLKNFSDGTDAIDALDVTGAATIGGAFTSPGIDDNANATAITIDSSENVMIGTTDSTPIGSGGIALRNEGRIDVSRDGAVVANFERRTNNGAMVQFYKDGHVVGQILCSDGSRIKLSLGGNNNAGITGGTGDDVILPTLNHSTSDNTVDIGSSGVRFNSMYLGGNLYLGGTAAANGLDMYEEGSWTPALSFGGSAAGIVYTVATGAYTRIGRQVTCMFDLRLSNNGSGSGSALLTGLPFNAGNHLAGTALEGGGVFTLHQSQGTAHTYASIIPDDSSSSAQMYADMDTTINNTHIGNSSTMRGVFTYFTA